MVKTVNFVKYALPKFQDTKNLTEKIHEST